MNLNYDKDIVRIKTYVEKHYWEDIGIEDIAKHVGYTPRHCNVIFKSCCGETLGSYLLTLRMEDAKRLLDSGLSVGRVARALSYRPRGFFRAFRGFYGVSPSEYVKTGRTLKHAYQTYEWKCKESTWGRGINPTSDGLWEFAYYNPKTKEYGLMEWFRRFRHFRAPFTVSDNRIDPNWYCRNRSGGNGMHPGRATQAVRAFLCPDSGTVEVFFSVGRLTEVKPVYTPCSVQLWHGDRPLGEPLVLTDKSPRYLTATLQVQKGDRIRLHLDPMGNHVGDGVFLYRQKISYIDPSEVCEEK